MSRTIRTKLTAVEINRAIKQLDEYKRRLTRVGETIARRLADEGLQVAAMRFSGAAYDGTNDVQVTIDESGSKCTLLASGKAVCFIEFGTGVHYNSVGTYPLPRPDGVSEIGTYGKGHGKQDVWRYQGDPGTNGVLMTPEDDPTVKSSYVLTQGNPAAMPMYYASVEMRDKIGQIAREAFASA